jgi:hypothetical protein
MSSFSRSPKSLTPLQESTISFTQFQECSEITERSNRLKCIQKITSENINKRLIQKIAFWSEQVSLGNKLIECPKEKLSLFPHASNDKYKLVKCFNFKQMKKDKKGILYFLDEGGLMKIDGIQFL